ncbi:MAG: xanthine dehydrogenase family protein subunit M [Dehalococcoidia bacterium]
MRRFQYFAPQSLDEAVTLLKEQGNGVRLLAGGTDLLVHMKAAGLHPPAVVSLHALSELRDVTFDETDGLRIGAGVDMAAIEAHPVVRERYTALADGAGVVGSVQTRNMATLGGNVCNAAPSADTTPPLVVFDAVAEVVGPKGSRRVPIGELFAGPGRTVLSSDDVVVAFHLPTPPARTGSVYQRHTPRKIMDIAVVGVGVRLTLAANDTISEARICLGAVAPTVIRATGAEEVLAGQAPSNELFARAAKLAKEAARPISDVRGSADFRRYIVGVMTERCLGIALERAKA